MNCEVTSLFLRSCLPCPGCRWGDGLSSLRIRLSPTQSRFRGGPATYSGRLHAHFPPNLAPRGPLPPSPGDHLPPPDQLCPHLSSGPRLSPENYSSFSLGLPVLASFPDSTQSTLHLGHGSSPAVVGMEETFLLSAMGGGREKNQRRCKIGTDLLTWQNWSRRSPPPASCCPGRRGPRPAPAPVLGSPQSCCRAHTLVSRLGSLVALPSSEFLLCLRGYQLIQGLASQHLVC